MVVENKIEYVYCDVCENKIIKCIDCKNDFIQNTNKIRCNNCDYNYNNNLINKKCIRCDEEMIIKNTELWRKYCKDCFIEIQDMKKNSPKCNCCLVMIEKTITKGVNRGRKGLGCQKFPKGCNEFQLL